MTRCVAVALAVLAAASLACSDAKQPPVAAGPTAADSAEQFMLGVGYFLTTRGVKRGHLVADTAYVYDDQNRFDFRRAKVDFNEENGAPSGTMRADRGVYNLRTQELEGWGNVVVTMVDGRTLKSPHVVYKQLTNELSSDTTYELAQGGRVQRGGAFKTDPNFNRFTCVKNCGASGPVQLPSP